MTHDVAAHIHEADPPKGGSAPNSVWNNEDIIDRLKELWETQSAREIAPILSEEFHITISRNAVIAKLHRLGLTVNDKKELHPQTRVRTDRAISRRPTLRLINGGNNSQVLIETVEGDVAPLQCASVEPLHLSLANLGPNDCRYPYGDGPFTFCGHPQRAKSSYCEAHHGLTWIPPTERNQRMRGGFR